MRTSWWCASVYVAAGLQAPLLCDYVENREQWLMGTSTGTGCSRDAAKELYLALINGGSPLTWATEHGVDPACVPISVLDFRAELLHNRDLLLEMPAYKPVLLDCIDEFAALPASERQGKCSRRTAFSRIICSFERRLLEALVLEAEASGYQVGVIIHDGMMVWKVSSFT